MRENAVQNNPEYGHFLRSVVLYIFVKDIFFSKVATYRLKTYKLVRERMEEISRNKFCKTLRKAILQNARGKTSMKKSFLIKFQI